MKEITHPSGKVLIVCDCHYPMLKDIFWHPWQSGREKGTDKWRWKNTHRDHYKHVNTQIHRYIMGSPKGMVIDHIDGNPSNNQCNNLRIVTRSQNNANQIGAKKNSKSGVKGIYWHKTANKWCAEVVHRRKKYYLGLFDDLEDARKARNLKAEELHGDYYRPA